MTKTEVFELVYLHLFVDVESLHPVVVKCFVIQMCRDMLIRVHRNKSLLVSLHFDLRDEIPCLWLRL